MLKALLGETCLLTSAFSEQQPCLAHEGREETDDGMKMGGGR